MKTKTHILSIAFLILASQLSYGQIWKKLKKKAEKAVEEVVVRKTADKAAEMAGKGMDKIFDINLNGAQADPSILPENYEFEWKYTLQMIHKQGTMNMNYYLKPDAKYFGSQAELEGNPMANGIFMVFDEELDIMAIFMDTKNGKGKAGQILKNSSGDIEELSEEDAAILDDYTFTELDTKTILGYECQGYQMENDELKMTMYFATDSPVSFNQVYGNHIKNVPEGFDPKWMEKAENSIIMEMDIENKKRKKHSAKMVCVALEESPKTLVVSEYEFMNLNTNPSGQN
ncbi:DUF4412 domain-containing protein [Winogradskyella sp. R77965]|uniref:DUF4412 domain-containing protein n=1 Tax=Winogradskyella sp. R77965 TaxID=3093872 RepID=UPI0037DBF104